MSRAPLVILIYRWMLGLYPATFREKYSLELESVFATRIRDQKNWLQAAWTLGLEFAALPRSLLFQFVRNRKGYVMADINSTDWSPSRWWQILMAANLVFIPAYAVITELFKTDLPGYVLLAFLAVMLVCGLITRMARWSLPAFGLLFSFAGLFIMSQIMMNIAGLIFPIPTAWNDQNRLLYQFLGAVAMTGYFLLFNLACLGVIMLIPPLRPFLRRVWKDWTLLSFLLYGATPIFLIIGFDEYLYIEGYIFAASIALAIGAWGYLRSSRPAWRWAWLAAGIACSAIICAVGSWMVVPLQLWPDTPSESIRINETAGKLIGMAAQIAFISVPVLLKTWGALAGGFMESKTAKPD